jgi:isopenicillin-N epimerase
MQRPEYQRSNFKEIIMNHQFGHAMLEHWSLDPEILYLNHGTVGVTPNAIMRVQQQLRDEIERQPARFMLRELEHHNRTPPAHLPRLREAANQVAAFFGVVGDDLVFVDNATTGVNAVLRSLSFAQDDEIVISDLAYGAVSNTAEYVARQCQARVVRIVPPFPDTSSEAVIASFEAALSSRTKIVVLDHVTASTALVLPVREIAALCHAKGVPVLIDGAHTPGALALNIADLGVDWYVGNLHKWAFAPRSCAILWAAKNRQADLHPTVISWGLDQGFSQEFDLLGTKDPTAFLAAPAALEFMSSLGAEAMRQYNHELVWTAAHLVAERLDTRYIVPKTMTSCMATVPLPESAGSSFEAAFELQHALLYQHKIEVPILEIRGRLYTRLAAQVYNQISDYERLAEILARLVGLESRGL